MQFYLFIILKKNWDVQQKADVTLKSKQTPKPWFNHKSSAIKAFEAMHDANKSSNNLQKKSYYSDLI